MKRKSVSINLEGEQMARNIAMLVQRASKYESSIYIQSGDKRVNAKSIMGMMTLGMDLSEDLEIPRRAPMRRLPWKGLPDF